MKLVYDTSSAEKWLILAGKLTTNLTNAFTYRDFDTLVPVWVKYIQFGSFIPHTVASVGQIHWEESFRARSATPERKSRVFTQEHEALKRAKSSVGAAK